MPKELAPQYQFQQLSEDNWVSPCTCSEYKKVDGFCKIYSKEWDVKQRGQKKMDKVAV